MIVRLSVRCEKPEQAGQDIQAVLQTSGGLLATPALLQLRQGNRGGYAPGRERATRPPALLTLFCPFRIIRLQYDAVNVLDRVPDRRRLQ